MAVRFSCYALSSFVAAFRSRAPARCRPTPARGAAAAPAALGRLARVTRACSGGAAGAGGASAGDGPTYEVCRMDDNGGLFVIKHACSAADAARVVAEFEARGHKQVYFYRLGSQGGEAGQHDGGAGAAPAPGQLGRGSQGSGGRSGGDTGSGDKQQL
ncbi:MAG: hypothetical protein J3K34DRAFT_404524 [Monoraphidium minutum]|nr:MAG: hypothetical protein J3K34DRAFT_404524 [Monoraphidium minutum]